MKNKSPKPPKTYQEFIRRFPKLGEAWENIAEAGRQGPLDDKTARLIKLPSLPALCAKAPFIPASGRHWHPASPLKRSNRSSVSPQARSECRLLWPCSLGFTTKSINCRGGRRPERYERIRSFVISQRYRSTFSICRRHKAMYPRGSQEPVLTDSRGKHYQG
jgi:hypothetical protein